MLDKFDKTLIRHIGSENYKGYRISYGISRFGSLFVQVQNSNLTHLYTCNNIIEAREAVDRGFKGKFTRPLIQLVG